MFHTTEDIFSELGNNENFYKDNFFIYSGIMGSMYVISRRNENILKYDTFK